VITSDEVEITLRLCCQRRRRKCDVIYALSTTRLVYLRIRLTCLSVCLVLFVRVSLLLFGSAHQFISNALNLASLHTRHSRFYVPHRLLLGDGRGGGLARENGFR